MIERSDMQRHLAAFPDISTFRLNHSELETVREVGENMGLTDEQIIAAQTEVRNCLREINSNAYRVACRVCAAIWREALPTFEQALQDPAKARQLLDASKGGNVPGITENDRCQLAEVLRPRMNEAARSYLLEQIRDIGHSMRHADGYGFIKLDRIIAELDELPLPGNQSSIELKG